MSKPYPKMSAGPGSLQTRYVRCGKARCRCVRGELHGPYVRWVYWQAGRQRRQYVRLASVEQVGAALAAWREQRDKLRAEREAIRSMRKQLAGMRRLLGDLTSAKGA